MAKFMVIETDSPFTVKKPEPAVIFLEGDEFRVEGNMEVGESRLRIVNGASAARFDIPIERRFEWFMSGSTFGAVGSWLGDTDNSEDAKRLEEVMGN